MRTLRDRLLTIEDDFQRALADGRDAVSAFNARLERLLTDVDSAWDADTLDDDTASLAHATALRISFLAETSVLIYSNCDTLTSQLVDEVETLMEELTISNTSVTRSRSCCKPFLEPSQEEPGTHQLPPRKRRRDSFTSPTSTETYKRRRASNVDVRATSPKSTHTQAYEAWPPTSSTASDVRPHAPTSRKRRLSDADITVPRQAKRLYAGPRLHAVSDSFPVLRTSDPEALCTRRLLRSPPPILSVEPPEISDTGLPSVMFFCADLDITQAESHASIHACSPLATSFSLDALDGFLSSFLEPTEPFLTLPHSLDTPYALLNVPLSPPSSSRSSSVSLDSSSSIASPSPPPSHPATPPPATCPATDLPPYQFHVAWDGNAASPIVSTTSVCDTLSIQGVKTMFTTQEPESPLDGSLGQDFIESDWSALFQSMNYLAWTPSLPPFYASKHSNEPSVHDIVADTPPIFIGSERSSIVT